LTVINANGASRSDNSILPGQEDAMRVYCLFDAAIVGLGLAFAITFAAWAASNVSPRFDGSYSGTLVPSPWMSKPDCAAIQIGTMTIKQGVIVRQPKAAVSFDGIVTEEGFVTGHLRRAGAAAVVFEGRFVGKELSGGIIDEAVGCAWTVSLAPVP
jgi:hypothetical protein